MIKEIVGSIPRDENFYDREDLIKDMWNIADEHDIFLIGPRRFGKSGILCRMYDKPEKGAKAIITELSKAGNLTKSELINIFMLATKSDDSSKFDDLMNDLEMDFYIKFDTDNNYSFLSKILSDWWLRWHPSSIIRW